MRPAAGRPGGLGVRCFHSSAPGAPLVTDWSQQDRTGRHHGASATRAHALSGSNVDVLVPNAQGQIDDLGALSAPEDLQDDVDQMLADAQTALDGLTDDPELVSGNEDPFADVYAQATEDRFDGLRR